MVNKFAKRRERPGGDDVHCPAKLGRHRLDAGVVDGRRARRSRRTASLRNAAFLPMLSIRSTWAPGFPPARRRRPPRESRRPSRDRPSVAPPAPAAGAGASPPHGGSRYLRMVDDAMRFVCRCRSSSSATKRLRRRDVSRETWKGAKARSRSAAASAFTSGRAISIGSDPIRSIASIRVPNGHLCPLSRLRGGLGGGARRKSVPMANCPLHDPPPQAGGDRRNPQAATAHIGGKQRQRGGRDALDPAGMAEGARPQRRRASAAISLERPGTAA